MNRRVSLCLVVLLLAASAVVLEGCGSRPAASADPVGLETARFRVSGSGTTLPLLRLLTKAYPDTSVAFVYLPGLHSKGGIQGVTQRDLNIGAVSRDLTDAEKKLRLRETWLSNDALLIATHPDVGVAGLTSEQVRGIYSGKYTDWSQVGRKSSLPIVVLDRNEDESAKIILRKFVLGPEATFKVTPKSIKLYYEPDMVQGLTSTPGAIGYFSLGYAISERIPVTRLKLDGVEASIANVGNGRYRVIRPLGVVTPPNEPANVAAFLEWASGPQAAAVMEKNGYAPIVREP